MRLHSNSNKSAKLCDNHADQDPHKKQLLMLLMGTAGTGKSYTVHAIKDLLGSSCRLLAFTGNAAFNIGGQTAHSLLWLPVAGKMYHEMNTQKKEQYEEFWPRHIKYVIIDEVSMVGQHTFYWIVSRLKQLTGSCLPFGGLNIILVGDFAQLPPVGDDPLWMIPKNHQRKQHGYWLYQQFDKAVTLTEVKRQDAEDAKEFMELLYRTRNGQNSREDWNKLGVRAEQKLDPQAVKKYKSELIRLQATNKKCSNYNTDKLLETGHPTAKMSAVHSCRRASTAIALKARGLWSHLFLSKDSKVRLLTNLWVEAGLYNGALGTVVDIIYAKDITPPNLPAVVLVRFKHFKGPALKIEGKVYKNVPIVLFEAEWFDGKDMSRKQIPLKLAWAIIIHASQGQTLEGAWIDIENKEHASGLTFVALSRIKTLANSVIERFTFKRLMKCKHKNTEARRKEEERIRKIENDMTVNCVYLQ